MRRGMRATAHRRAIHRPDSSTHLEPFHRCYECRLSVVLFAVAVDQQPWNFHIKVWRVGQGLRLFAKQQQGGARGTGGRSSLVRGHETIHRLVTEGAKLPRRLR